MYSRLTIFWLILVTVTAVNCTADDSAPPASKTDGSLRDCEQESPEVLLTADSEDEDAILIEEGEVGIEIVDESEPCKQTADQLIKGGIENNKIPLIIKIPDADPLTDEAAIAYLKSACLSCHDSEGGSVKSFWAMNAGISKDELQVDPLAPAVYYSLVVKAKGIQAKPKAMPDRDLSDKEKQDLPGLIRWFEVEMPTVVASAAHRYNNGEGGSVGVTLNYRCQNPVTFRKYLKRITNDAFDRNPTVEEIKSLAASDPDLPVSRADRNRIAQHMFEETSWREQFMEVGLRKFAQKIAGAGDILPYGDEISEEAAIDLRDEFYQYLKKYIDSKTWKDILLAKSVLVSSHTASLYEDCSAPDPGSWKECDLKDKRGSYFSTVSYLRSKSSSFLIENNNYGRSALMHFIVSGDVFKAAFDEDAGDSVNDLPACLQSNDWRGRVEGESFAGFGSIVIPSTGNLCQSCHIDRQMAAGSMLFRPFNKAGLIYGQSAVLTEDEDYLEATAENKKNRPDFDVAQETIVDEAFLSNLLAENTGACMPARGSLKQTEFNNVGDLAAYIIGDGRVLAGGLSRHLPRAMSNLLNTTEEIIVRVNNAYFDEDTAGMLIPVFQAYFSSETFACEAKEL